MTKAIIFDAGNVIVRFDNSIFLDKIVRHTDKSVSELHKIIYRKSGPFLLYETGLIGFDEFYGSIVSDCGLKMSKRKFLQAFTDIFHCISQSVELIKALKPRYKLGLISNTNELHFKYAIKSLSVFSLFDSITLSFQVKAMKPEAAIYQHAMEKLGLQAGECLFIDDTAENVRAAEMLGMKGIIYTSPNRLCRDLKQHGIRM